jgi:2Fe-2S ferredoxin
MVRVTFLPQGFTVPAQRGDTLLDAALANGVALPHDCGGNCACTTCHVHVLEGSAALSPMEDVEEDRLRSAESLTPASRLGCQALLLGGDVTVTIVEEPSEW